MELFLAILLCTLLVFAAAGYDFPRLVEPPPRGSLPGGYLPIPEAYGGPGVGKHPQDLNCGGYEEQWLEQGGQCGVCGDPFAGPRTHEEGGPLAHSPQVRSYTAGQTIRTKVLNGRRLEGWMEFRLCARNSSNEGVVTAACMEERVLALADGTGTSMYIRPHMRAVKVALRLPDAVSCDACVFQWYYRTALRYGTDGDGRSCRGCGPQLEYYNCADIVIDAPEEPATLSPEIAIAPTDRPAHDVLPAWLQPQPEHRQVSASQWHNLPVAQPASSANCHAIGAWARKGANLDAWCREKCAYGSKYCPGQICAC